MKKLILSLFVLFVMFQLVGAQEPANYDQYLINCLKDDNIGIRTSAAQLLGERKVSEAFDPISKMLRAEKRYAARIMYATALINIDREKAMPVLKNIVQNDPNKTARRFAAGAMQDISKNQVALK